MPETQKHGKKGKKNEENRKMQENGSVRLRKYGKQERLRKKYINKKKT